MRRPIFFLHNAATQDTTTVLASTKEEALDWLQRPDCPLKGDWDLDDDNWSEGTRAAWYVRPEYAPDVSLNNMKNVFELDPNMSAYDHLSRFLEISIEEANKDILEGKAEKGNQVVTLFEQLLVRLKAERSDCVLQPWVMQLPWKMQSILFSSLRGPDQELHANIKQVSKWMRSVTQQNADPSKPYMNNIEIVAPTCLDKELEHCPCHFVHHFADGLAIIAYHHPDPATAEYAAKIHYHIAEEIFHFVPEHPAIFNLRHRDKRGGQDVMADGWRCHCQNAESDYLTAVMDRFQDERA